MSSCTSCSTREYFIFYPCVCHVDRHTEQSAREVEFPPEHHSVPPPHRLVLQSHVHWSLASKVEFEQGYGM